MATLTPERLARMRAGREAARKTRPTIEGRGTFHTRVWLNGVPVMVDSQKGGNFRATAKGVETRGPTRQAALLALAEKLML